MMTPAERMRTDAVFAALVHQFVDMFENNCGSGAGITPSEVREASGLAWQIYAQTHQIPMMVEPLAHERRR